jgi:hypothetical protein
MVVKESIDLEENESFKIRISLLKGDANDVVITTFGVIEGATKKGIM